MKILESEAESKLFGKKTELPPHIADLLAFHNDLEHIRSTEGKQLNFIHFIVFYFVYHFIFICICGINLEFRKEYICAVGKDQNQCGEAEEASSKCKQSS